MKGWLMISEDNGTRTTEQIQEMIQKREVAVDLLADGEVRRKLLVQLTELRRQAPRPAQGPR
jgi:hypothetical protein